MEHEETFSKCEGIDCLDDDDGRFASHTLMVDFGTDGIRHAMGEPTRTWRLCTSKGETAVNWPKRRKVSDAVILETLRAAMERHGIPAHSLVVRSRRPTNTLVRYYVGKDGVPIIVRDRSLIDAQDDCEWAAAKGHALVKTWRGTLPPASLAKRFGGWLARVLRRTRRKLQRTER